MPVNTKRGAEDRVMLSDEIDFLRDYLALESLRLGPRLRLSWDVEERVLADELPPLTLQPLVENAILHAVAPRKGGGTVTITARRDRATQGLTLAVADDGPGCEPAALQPQPGQRRGVEVQLLRHAHHRALLLQETQARQHARVITVAKRLPIAQRHGVIYVTGDAFFVNGEGAHYVRLAFSKPTPAQIQEGVRRFAAAVTEASSASAPARARHRGSRRKTPTARIARAGLH